MFENSPIPPEWAHMYTQSLADLERNGGARRFLEAIVDIEIRQRIEAAEIFGREAAEEAPAHYSLCGQMIHVRLAINLDLIPPEKRERAEREWRKV
ncbi:hypothetical protein XM53_16390 [Roseovarius atlanticus]|uniref:Uncharacterized protein n=1 Tax=Roseovarius atlanticus TaxID=1641875 RepID=A0A0T5NRS4_9RHOB|nr:hypothetical protein [Roseovarius atlanticus]KRS11516.1 hypothetical protein XM53_16390 [Roseovarius atlanticus]